MKVTTNQKIRTRELWSEYAGEKVKVEFPNHDTSLIYAFGSELACLRLFKRFASEHTLRKGKDKIRVEFSENYDSWFFSLTNFTE